MSLFDVVKKSGASEPEKNLIDFSVICFKCDVTSPQSEYDNESGLVKMECDCGEVNEIYIGAGREN
jgi:hypothetical protein